MIIHKAQIFKKKEKNLQHKMAQQSGLLDNKNLCCLFSLSTSQFIQTTAGPRGRRGFVFSRMRRPTFFCIEQHGLCFCKTGIAAELHTCIY